MNNAPTNSPDTNKTSALAARKSRSSGPGMKGIAIHDVGSIASVASATPARMMSTPNVIATCAATRVNLYFIYLTSRRQVRVLQPHEPCLVTASRAPARRISLRSASARLNSTLDHGPRLTAPAGVQHQAQHPVDAEPGVPAAGVGVCHCLRASWSTVSGRRSSMFKDSPPVSGCAQLA
jgi:hypothetical protein